jgi:hypothetical protein
MTTLKEASEALSANVAELQQEQKGLVTKCDAIIAEADALANRVMREHPEAAAKVLPVIDQLKAAAAKLHGSLQ